MVSEYDQRNIDRCVRFAEELWVGEKDGKFICAWGLCPPTLMSNSAYLWLYTTEALRGNEFLFVRRSQIAVKDMLKLYPTITGYCQVGSEGSARWLRWLGASFFDPVGSYIPFVITR